MRARDTASKRTKNRLREHGQAQGHGLKVEERGRRVVCFGGEPSTGLVCACGWRGWIPESEVLEEEGAGVDHAGSKNIC